MPRSGKSDAVRLARRSICQHLIFSGEWASTMEAIQFGQRFLRARHALIGVFIAHCPSTTGSIFPQLGKLHLGIWPFRVLTRA